MNTKRRIANVADLETSIYGNAQRNAGFKRDQGLGCSATPPQLSLTFEDLPNFTDGAMFDGVTYRHRRKLEHRRTHLCVRREHGDLHAIRCSFFFSRTRMHGNDAHEQGPLVEINFSIAGVHRRYKNGQNK